MGKTGEKKQRYTISLDEESYKMIEEFAQEMGCTMTFAVAYLAREGKAKLQMDAQIIKQYYDDTANRLKRTAAKLNKTTEPPLDD